MFLVPGKRVWYTEFTKDTQMEETDMRCSCRVCGTYMVQREQGVESGCVCPECFSVCTACVTPEGGQPLSPEALKRLFLSRQFLEKEENGYADPFHGPIGPAEYED